MTTERLGWIIIHSTEKYGKDKEYDSPIEELDSDYEKGMRWHWQQAKPPRVGGPYTLLLAWDGKIFGDSPIHVEHVKDSKEFNFAFTLDDFKKRRSVALGSLPLGNRLYEHRSLIRLDAEILAAYNKLK